MFIDILNTTGDTLIKWNNDISKKTCPPTVPMGSFRHCHNNSENNNGLGDLRKEQTENREHIHIGNCKNNLSLY